MLSVQDFSTQVSPRSIPVDRHVCVYRGKQSMYPRRSGWTVDCGKTVCNIHARSSALWALTFWII